MLFLTQENELEFINQFQCLYFYASWMPYHKKMISMLDKMEKKYKNMHFVAIDVDFFKILCKRFAVESIPTIVVFSKGLEIKRINGLILMSALKSAFADICESGDNYGKEIKKKPR